MWCFLSSCQSLEEILLMTDPGGCIDEQTALFHTKLIKLNNSDVFQRMSRFVVGSWAFLMRFPYPGERWEARRQGSHKEKKEVNDFLLKCYNTRIKNK